MRTEFNWRTEAEDWDETGDLADERRRAGTKSAMRRWLSWMGIVLILLLIASGVAWRLIQQRVAETTARMERDLLASHQVIQEAATSGDAELLVPFLSGRDSEWARTQVALAQLNRLLDHPDLELRTSQLDWAKPLAGNELQPQVTLAHDLQQAEVALNIPYTVQLAGGITKTAYLERTIVYRRGADRWLWSPPDETFWGYRGQSQGWFINFRYHERDAALLRRITRDLDRAVEALCQRTICPPDLSLTIIFDSDPASLLLPAWPERLASPTFYRLPTPSLIGLPLDEAGYQALTTGYARIVLEPLLADLNGWRCCQQAIFVKALAERQLHELGITPWPMTPAHYDALNAMHPDMLSASHYWPLSPAAEAIGADTSPLIYALVEFLLLHNPQLSPMALMHELATSDSYIEWLGRFIDVQAGEQAWRTFLFEQTTMGSRPLPSPLPDQQLQVRCDAASGMSGAIFYHNPKSDDWTMGTSFPGARGIFRATPLARGAVLLEEVLGQGMALEWRVSLIKDGQQIELLQSAFTDEIRYLLGSVHPSRDRLTITAHHGASDVKEHLLLELAHCQAGACSLAPLAGELTWSPDGQKTFILIQESEQTRSLFLGEADGTIQRLVTDSIVASSGSPIWLDNDRFAYLRFTSEEGEEGNQGEELVIAESSSVLASHSMSGIISQIDARQPALRIGAISLHPSNPTQLLLVLDSAAERPLSYVGFLKWQTGAFELLPDTGHAYARAFLSPDGRHLALYERYGRGPTWTLSLYSPLAPASSLAEGEAVMPETATPSWTLDRVIGPGLPDFRNHSFWSADSQWLLHQDEHDIYLVATTAAYERPLILPHRGCVEPVWME